MPWTDADLAVVQQPRIERFHVGAGGRWVSITGEVGRVAVEVGSTGNSLDPQRRVRLSRTEIVAARDTLAVHTRWPVAERITHQIGQLVDDLHGDLIEAGDDSPDDTLTDVAALLSADPEGGLARVILASAYPLLAAPLEAGARIPEVPVPLESIVRHTTPRAAAETRLCPSKTTRPLVRALAASLLPDDNGTIAWERPLLALMAAPRCGPEQITSILTSVVHHPGAVSFSLDDVQRARWMFAERHPRRVAETLCAALEQNGGTAELAREISAFGHRPRRPVADAVDEVAPPVRRAAPKRDLGREPIEHAASLRAIEGTTVAGLTVTLPRTPDELLEWGLDMGNCLGRYRGSVARRNTHIIGFTKNRHSLLHVSNRLEVVAEVSPHRVLRQLEAPHNTVPAPRVAEAIVDFLREHRVMEADGRTR